MIITVFSFLVSVKLLETQFSFNLISFIATKDQDTTARGYVIFTKFKHSASTRPFAMLRRRKAIDLRLGFKLGLISVRY